MTFAPLPNYDASLLKDSTLIMPTVSIGNVPQLVSDLLIHTFELQRVGFLDDDSLVPVAGIREDTTQPGVTVPLEVFQSKDGKWTCIQQRSPTMKGKRKEFIANMTQFAQQFQQVIVVTSMDAARRLDSQINGPPFRVSGALSGKGVEIGVPELEKEGQEDKLHLPGSGLATQLYTSLSPITKTTLLIMFALEGDNVNDAIEYSNVINTILQINLTISGWKPPKSWAFLFGTPVNSTLYN